MQYYSTNGSTPKVSLQTAVVKGLVVGGAACDVKIVSARTVPFGVNAVKGKGNLRVNVGAQGRFGPGGVYFAGRHVFDIIGKTYVHILRWG